MEALRPATVVNAVDGSKTQNSSWLPRVVEQNLKKKNNNPIDFLNVWELQWQKLPARLIKTRLKCNNSILEPLFITGFSSDFHFGFLKES